MSRLPVYIIFFISGMLALGYQSIWSRYLGHLLGHAALAQTLAVSAFMLGLGIGSWCAGSRSTMNARKALIAYVLVELGIAVWGFLFHSAYIGLESHTHGSFVYQYLLALLLITPPAAAMGATFPLFWRGMTQSGLMGEASSLPMLYFVNALGGSAGALITTFMLVPAFGLPGSLTVFWIGNLVLGVLVFAIYVKRVEEERPSNAEPTPDEVHSKPAASFETFALIAALTGATSLIYQVVWFRMVALSLGSSQHSFEIVLSSFIFALAVGALVLSRIETTISKNTVAWCSVAQIAMGCFAILSFVFWYAQFPWVSNFISSIRPGGSAYNMYLALTLLISLVLVFPTAFWAGMTLPLLTRSALGFGPKTVGYIYAWNTAGCMIGAMVATHLLINNFGIKLTLLLAGVADICLGLYLLKLLPQTALRARLLAAALVFSLGAVLAMQSVKEDKVMVTSGAFRHGRLIESGGDDVLLYYRDGKTASINALRTGNTLNVSTNGKVDGSISLTEKAAPDEYTMVITGLIGSLFHQGTRKEAVIVGFGTGVSTHSILADKGIKQVTTVEIEPAVVDAAKFLVARNVRAYNDRRSKIVFNDAKSFMNLDARRWDIIISEPSNPWVGGVSNLFSKEFYGTVKRKLKDDGTFVQWLQVYETNDKIASSAILALHTHFPSFRVFDIGQGDWIIVARKDDAYVFNDTLFNDSDIREALARVGVKTEADMLSKLIGTENEFIPMALKIGAPANSDFYPFLFVNSPRARFEATVPQGFGRMSSGDLQRVALSSAGIISVDNAKEHNRDGQNVPSLRGKAEFEDMLGTIINSEGVAELHPSLGPASTLLARLQSCDLRAQESQLGSIERILDLFVSSFSYPNLEAIVQKGLTCPSLLPEFRVILEYALLYSKRDYSELNARSLQVLETKGLSELAAIILRQIAISSALITKDCKLAAQLDNDSVDFTRKALIGACKAN